MRVENIGKGEEGWDEVSWEEERGKESEEVEEGIRVREEEEEERSPKALSIKKPSIYTHLSWAVLSLLHTHTGAWTLPTHMYIPPTLWGWEDHRSQAA